MPTQPTLFHRAQSIAAQLDVSTRTVRRWIDEGHLKAHRLGRSVRVSEIDLRAFLANRKR